MTPRPHSSEDDMLLALSQALDHTEPIPERLKRQAYEAFSLGTMQDALAELIFDSLQGSALAMRGDETEARLLSFANDFVTLDMSLAADEVTIIGEIQPAVSDQLLIESDTGEPLVVRVDQFGRFRAACEAGSFRIRVPHHLVTPWVTRG